MTSATSWLVDVIRQAIGSTQNTALFGSEYTVGLCVSPSTDPGVIAPVGEPTTGYSPTSVPSGEWQVLADPGEDFCALVRNLNEVLVPFATDPMASFGYAVLRDGTGRVVSLVALDSPVTPGAGDTVRFAPGVLRFRVR